MIRYSGIVFKNWSHEATMKLGLNLNLLHIKFLVHSRPVLDGLCVIQTNVPLSPCFFTTYLKMNGFVSYFSLLEDKPIVQAAISTVRIKALIGYCNSYRRYNVTQKFKPTSEMCRNFLILQKPIYLTARDIYWHFTSTTLLKKFRSNFSLHSNIGDL
jgi:hypothetical protein